MRHVLVYKHYSFLLVIWMVQMRGSKGEMVNAEQLSFKIINEGFSEYELSDGRTMKIRVVLADEVSCCWL